jgi:hypothetical protein
MPSARLLQTVQARQVITSCVLQTLSHMKGEADNSVTSRAHLFQTLSSDAREALSDERVEVNADTPRAHLLQTFLSPMKE